MMALASYTPSTGILRFAIETPHGFSGGDFAAISVDVSSGAPLPTDFTLTNQRVIDTAAATLNIPVTLK